MTRTLPAHAAKRTWLQQPLRWTALPLLLGCTLGGVASAQPAAPDPVGTGSESTDSLHFPGLRIQSTPVSMPPESAEPASAFRERDSVVLGYEAPLRLGESDLLFKLRAPGKRRSIVTFEVVF